MEDSILNVLKIISCAAVIDLIVLSFKALGKNRSGAYMFSGMVIFFFFSSVFFGNLGIAEEWAKHLLFYTGQVFSFGFLHSMIEYYRSRHLTDEGTAPSIKPSSYGIIPVVGASSLTNFLTEQGLQHFLVLPITFLITTYISVKKSILESQDFRDTLDFFMAALFAFAMVHFFELAVESQKWLPSLEPFQEFIEFGWFFIGYALCGIGLARVRNQL